ncbi:MULTISPECIES: aldehyde dehydrogenase (NADP(+)) [unclassified Saccharicrinis]|uniref:aldehyde dehydrogenase (NADP(+)) n=1 Tax=unclassified Saccharicrinis TaxID=2646859 RepID=UPI003D333BA5
MSSLAIQYNEIVDSASRAFLLYKKISGTKKAVFLKQIALEIEDIGDQLIETVMRETSLPEGRVRGERARTINQILQFAQLIEEGSWVEAVIDQGNPDREPLPKPDLRKMLIPMGPIVVFGAGNFPLAFSVAGGDTISALAGGNPVIVKGHPAHPKTGLLVANAILKAVEVCKLPQGTFSYVEESSYEAGQLLVKHPMTKAVAFTGSEKGGRALFDIANERDEPIPVFAEMGSVNPVVILPKALENKGAEMAKQLVASINLGSGQFCTNPGLILVIKGPGYAEFLQTLASEVIASDPTEMFSEGILKNYKSGLTSILHQEGISALNDNPTYMAQPKAVPVLGTVDAETFVNHKNLHQEVFGPFSLVVTCTSADELIKVVKSLKGQLTCTLQSDHNEESDYKELIEYLVLTCGRLLFNGVPTGVEVCPAMQHGGPYPASTDVRFTSVGTAAIKRFVRPISYQDCPEELLPEELKNSNPLGIWRWLNSEWTKQVIT